MLVGRPTLKNNGRLSCPYIINFPPYYSFRGSNGSIRKIYEIIDLPTIKIKGVYAASIRNTTSGWTKRPDYSNSEREMTCVSLHL